MIKIYAGKSILVVTEERNTSINSHYMPIDANQIIDILGQMQRSESALLYIHETNSIADTLASIQTHYEPVIAAGGIVTNTENEVLMINRKGYWDLPKGKLDLGESIPECAVREVNEETGLRSLQLGAHIANTYHIYDTYGSDTIKTTYWYAMKADKNDVLQPQLEEDIIEAKWIPTSEMKDYLGKTYPTIQDLFGIYLAH